MVTMSSEYSIYLYREKVDLRKGTSGLSGIVRDEMRLNPNTAKGVYVFSGRNFGRKSERNAGRGRDDDGPSGRGGTVNPKRRTMLTWRAKRRGMPKGLQATGAQWT